MLAYEKFIKVEGKSKILLFPPPLLSWEVHLLHSHDENSLLMLLTAPGHKLALRRSVWGFREGEKNVRQVPSSSCWLQINTRLLAYDLPMFPSFYLKRRTSWFRMGNTSQTLSSSDCVWIFFCLVSKVYSTLYLRFHSSTRNCSHTVGFFDQSVQSEFKMSGGMEFSFKRNLNSLGDSHLHWK